MRRAVITALTIVGVTGAGARAASAQGVIGDFYLFEDTDPSTGEDRSSVTTVAEENWVSGSGGLTFWCSEDGLELIVTVTYLGRKMSTPVGYAFGDEDPHVASWRVRSSGMAAIAPTEVRDAFIEGAADATSVVVRVTDFQMRGYAYTFHIGGLEEALSELSCR